mgnify:CR=1 FL=1
MARRNSYGKVILSAGEVGSYVTCPEAWRLQAVKGEGTIPAESVKEGAALHREWFSGLSEAVFLSTAARLLLDLAALLVIAGLLRYILNG